MSIKIGDKFPSGVFRVKDTDGIKEIPTDKVVFKVQIGTYLKSMLNEGSFKEINAEEQVLNGTFKYFVGNELDKIVADNLKLI